MICVIIFGAIIIAVFIFSLIYIAPFTPSDDDLQWKEIQKWKEKKKDA